MELKLEVIGIPVSDVDRAKAFYVEQVGFGLDHDVEGAPGMRVVQMTPPGSACSVVIGSGMPLAARPFLNEYRRFLEVSTRRIF